MAKCIECDANLEVVDSKLETGEIVICPECGVELEVLKVAPLKLAKAPDEDDDFGE